MFESHADDQTIFEGMMRTCPDIALHSVDEYIATILQWLSDEPDALQRRELADLNTVFVICGYGQSRSIPYYIYLSPKANEKQVSHVTNYLPIYETIMSKDTTEMQVEKLVLTDLLHSNQLNDSNSQAVLHPWTLDLIREKMAPENILKSILNSKLSQKSRYEAVMDE